MNLSPFRWRSYAQVCPCVRVRLCVCIHRTDISLAPSAPLKIRRRAERMKRDKVQNKDERRNKRRVASLLFRARTMFRPFSHALYNALSAPMVYSVSKTIGLYFQFIEKRSVTSCSVMQLSSKNFSRGEIPFQMCVK